MVRLTLDEAYELASRVLSRHGFNAAHTAALADTLVAGQRDECASHGLYRLLGLIDTLRAGKVVPNAIPVLTDQAPAIVKVDAGGAFSPLAFRTGLPVLADKARHCGIAAMAINRCVHFSALWVELEAITALGLVGLACNPSHAWVAPAGGARPVFGTNPFAFGWPRKGKPPFVFDFATSAVARGEIELHRRAGIAIPTGWGVDGTGQPCTDPGVVLDQGAMLTFGGHKGAALAAMIELIAGPLIGDLTSQESLDFDGGSRSLPHHGELIIALDPVRFLGDAADQELERAEVLFSAMQQEGARLPSQRRFEARARSLARGVELPPTLHADITALLD